MAGPKAAFDEWVDQFHQWRDEIGFDHPYINQYQFETLLAEEVVSPVVEFGDFAGQPKWERLRDIPGQNIKDALLHLIIYQGDTEFASVEQQRELVNTAPSEWDMYCLGRVMCEEMRHGWQMCYLMIEHFGDEGRREALKQLERRSWKKQRLLGSFNEDVTNWVDFFVYTNFVDRDGKFQLKMLEHSAFQPLARSVTAMLKEENFHMGTGTSGMQRILKAGIVPVPLFQKWLNKWIPTAYDLFGKDESGSAEWAYVWGLKGRYDESPDLPTADKKHLNERSRVQFHEEVDGIIQRLNKVLPVEGPKLITPDLKFNRRIGLHAGQPYAVTGELLSPEEHKRHLAEVLPGPADEAAVLELQQVEGWIEHRDYDPGKVG